ncbi:MAG TPA: condensation domain-containing protein, partial [Pyrinomonadaceae bacterium]|nr:condensation domain-containing protein [Pyrinomonadaceae bacterium]
MSFRDILDIYPLSPMQEGMLFHSLYDQNSGVYFNQVALTLEGQLDLAALKRAWQRVMQRHSILRSSFEWEEIEKPLQVVHREVELELRYEDLGELSKEAEEERVKQWLAANLDQPFDLSQAPLMRLGVLQTGKERQQFFWSFHHILLDGWSVSLVLGEVFSFYRGEIEGT